MKEIDVSLLDNVYTERNRLVAALSKLFPSHLMPHTGNEEWNEEWNTVVCIHLPTGQVTWHVKTSEINLYFSHLTMTANHWDGHDTEEKYRRVDNLSPYNTTITNLKELITVHTTMEQNIHSFEVYANTFYIVRNMKTSKAYVFTDCHDVGVFLWGKDIKDWKVYLSGHECTLLSADLYGVERELKTLAEKVLP